MPIICTIICCVQIVVCHVFVFVVIYLLYFLSHSVAAYETGLMVVV